MSHTYPNNGNYNIALVVTDTKGATDTAATTATVAIEQAAILVGAGNIATCGSPNAVATAQLIDALPPDATVFTLGDNAFPAGTLDDYTSCYAPTWGRFLARTWPTLGNHEYQTGDAKGSFDYFGDRVGPRDKGYYSYDLAGGAWHVIVLNDHGGSTIDAEQMSWLAADLQANAAPCTIAMWHVPLFLSSNTPGWTVNPDHKPIWDLLYASGVELVLNGQQHDYERFAPMTPDGAVDSVRGIREFLVGTGGESVDQFSAVHPNSLTQASQFGVLKLSLRHDGYDWQFIPVAGQPSYSDSGSGTCH
jgi:PKD repeat protein